MIVKRREYSIKFTFPKQEIAGERERDRERQRERERDDAEGERETAGGSPGGQPELAHFPFGSNFVLGSSKFL